MDKEYLKTFAAVHLEGNLLQDTTSYFADCSRVQPPRWYSMVNNKAQRHDHLYQAVTEEAEFYVLERIGSGGKVITSIHNIIFLSKDFKLLKCIPFGEWILGDIGNEEFILVDPQSNARRLKTDHIAGFPRIVGMVHQYMKFDSFADYKEPSFR
jgi:hypothetical protein